jgi:hypothetical protein
MTTHDQYTPEAVDSRQDPSFVQPSATAPAPTERPAPQEDAGAARDRSEWADPAPVATSPDPAGVHEVSPPAADPTPPPVAAESVEAPAPASHADIDDQLFADDELSGLRAHWDEVQAAFVDDPQQCVQKADALVSDLVEKLTSGFSETRSRLEAQWASGQEASTEDLRLALKKYREFFQRLLAV